MTFLTDMMEKGYTQEEIFAVLFESEKDQKRRRRQAIVTETIGAHHLRKMRDLLAFAKLATWRMNAFDRVEDGEDNWFHARSLPTPEEFSASLRSDLQLKNAISMPAETRPWQKTMDFVNELEQDKVSDEEFAVLERLVEKGSREAAQAQVTITPVDTVQHCKQPIIRIEDRLFDRGWVRSAMATRKCRNIYFRKYFMAVRKFTNIFVLLFILMVGSRHTLFLVCFT